MPRVLTLLPILAAAGLLAACSRPPSVPDHARKHPPKPQAGSQTARRATPLDPLMHDLDRAKSVQATVDAHARAQQKAIEKQTH